MTNDLVLLSGGLDSATVLADRYVTSDVRLALAINYGQRHATELEYAEGQAFLYSVPFRKVDISSWGALVDRPLLRGSTATNLTGAATIVPNRNAVLISVAASVALTHGCNRIVLGVHAGDHAVYPDCRPKFIDAADRMVQLATDGAVRLEAPFLHRSKSEIVMRAHQLHVEFDLTWSCYAGGTRHCGRCDACIGRHDAFVGAGIPDPTDYVAVPDVHD